MTKKWVRTFAECGATKFDEPPYITIGKWYEAEGNPHEICFEMDNDENFPLICCWKGCAHLDGNDWEVYEGDTPPQEETP